jgi:hypothetical protein
MRPCEHPGCRRVSFMRLCPEHADDDQHELERELKRALVEADLAGARVRELEERLGIDRRSGAHPPAGSA